MVLPFPPEHRRETQCLLGGFVQTDYFLGI